MKSRKKKTNKELEKGISWCMHQLYIQSLAIKALQEQISESSQPQNPEES